MASPSSRGTDRQLLKSLPILHSTIKHFHLPPSTFLFHLYFHLHPSSIYTSYFYLHTRQSVRYSLGAGKIAGAAAPAAFMNRPAHDGGIRNNSFEFLQPHYDVPIVLPYCDPASIVVKDTLEKASWQTLSGWSWRALPNWDVESVEIGKVWKLGGR